MSKFFDEVFDDFLLGFGKPRSLVFKSQVKDMMPSYWKKDDDNNYVCVCRTTGINPEDVMVEETEYGLKVSGSTEIDGYTYSTSFELPIVRSIMDQIQKIKVSSKNGLTFITLLLNKPEKRKLLIEKT